MKPNRRVIFCTALITLSAPLWADSPKPPPVLPAQAALDTLAGKTQVVGFTERDGTRFLGRVLSGDHGSYVVQTFHYVTAPRTTPETTSQTLMVAGRNGRLRPQTKKITTQVTTQNTIADDTAVRALLSGVAGYAFRPLEEAGRRELITPADVMCLQTLSPPTKPTSPGWTMKTLWMSPEMPGKNVPSANATTK